MKVSWYKAIFGALFLLFGWIAFWPPSSTAFAVNVDVPNGQVLAQDDFSTNSGLWEYGGTSLLTNGYLQLTPSSSDKAGLLWYNKELAPPYSVSFDYRITNSSSTPADGLVFMFNKNKSFSLVTGGGLGFQPGNGYGVEFDTYANEWDPVQDHLTLFKTITNHNVPGTKLSQATDPTITNGEWHRVRVEVTDTTIKVYMDNTLRINCTGTLDTSYKWLGFAAATGGSFSRHQIDNVMITSPSSDATLSTLSMEGQAFAFQPATTSYSITVPFETNVAHLHFAPAYPLASVLSVTSSVANAVYGVTPTSANANLSIGPNTITIQVRAENGAMQPYTLRITRNGASNAYLNELTPLGGGLLAPAFQAGTTFYDLYLPASQTEAYVRFSFSDPNATYSVTGAVYGSGLIQSLAPLQPGGPIFLPLSTQLSWYDLKVTAQDHLTSKTYRIQMRPIPEAGYIGYARMMNGDTLEAVFTTPIQLPAASNLAAFNLTGTTAKVIEVGPLQVHRDRVSLKLKLDHPIPAGDIVFLNLLQGAAYLPNQAPLLQLNAKVLTRAFLDSLKEQLSGSDGTHIDDILRAMQAGTTAQLDLNVNGRVDRYDIQVLLGLITTL